MYIMAMLVSRVGCRRMFLLVIVCLLVAGGGLAVSLMSTHRSGPDAKRETYVADDEYVTTIGKYSHVIEQLSKIIRASGQALEGNYFYSHLVDISTGEHVQSIDMLPKRQNMFYLAKHATRICEIGFNAGHSCLLMLLANPNSSIVCFDICHHAYTLPCFEYLESQFPGRLTLICGDSSVTVPSFHGEGFDLIHVDGNHTYDGAKSDIDNVLPMLKPGGRIVLDDDDMLHDLHMEYIADGKLSVVDDVNIQTTPVSPHLVVEKVEAAQSLSTLST
jgi:predicted O-methyltransferase YrrM